MASNPPAPTLGATLSPAIHAAASALGLTAPSLNGNGKTYEAWALFEIALGLTASWSVRPFRHNGTALPPGDVFVVRGGPGFVPNLSASGPEPCFFVVLGSQAFELHNSLQHVGVSGVFHELDISVLPHPIHRDQHERRPYQGHVVAGVELKAYDSATDIPKSFARAFVGAIVDVAPFSVFQIRVGARRFTKWGDEQDAYALLTTANMTPQTASYLSYYGVQPGAAQSVTNRATLDAFIARVDAFL